MKNKSNGEPLSVKRTIHPFPARMASSIALKELKIGSKMKVLDPMVGSGTTLMVARQMGHECYGFDADPLAVLISKCWCFDVRNSKKIVALATNVLKESKQYYKNFANKFSYPCFENDIETKMFIDYWFNTVNRKQLLALARVIGGIRSEKYRTIFWCAFSRLIIAKDVGASLARDLSHSRPHKTENRTTIKPFEEFEKSVLFILKKITTDEPNGEDVRIRVGNARKMPLKSNSIDCVITSPPYLNAIDYLRCSKFSLVWMGYSLHEIKRIRKKYIGNQKITEVEELESILGKICGKKTPIKIQRLVRPYIYDLNDVVGEINRVLKINKNATFVIGNSRISKIPINNARIIILLARKFGLKTLKVIRRKLPNNRRYLPPPKVDGNAQMNQRMRFEYVLKFKKIKIAA
jgi:DNA modification methylase